MRNRSAGTLKTVDCPTAESLTFGMGTVITHKIYGKAAQLALRAAEAETARLERLLSRFLPGSDISRINNMAGRGPVRVRQETFEVLSRALAYSSLTDGAFDVTVGPLVTLWDVLKRTAAPPSEIEINDALSLVDYSGFGLTDNIKSAALKKNGQSIDLGGIGKGYAADKVIEVFKTYNIVSAFTNFGGNVAVIGAKPDGAPWRIGIQHPRRKDGLIGTVSITSKSVVTSGDYQRCFTADNGKRYHHIFDPRTGYPADRGLVGVTVVAGSSMDADALSTAIFVLGPEKGMELLSEFPGTEAVLVDADMTVFLTKGLVDGFCASEDVIVKIIKN